MSLFFDDTAPPEIYTLSLHDALPISLVQAALRDRVRGADEPAQRAHDRPPFHVRDGGDEQERGERSEEHTSELQSHSDLVCRLLLEKKKKKRKKKKKYANKTRAQKKH